MGWVSAFTGRAAELALLRQGVRGGSTTLVVGDPGIGKTRLAAECAAEFEGDRWLVVSASCLPLAEQLPLLPIVDGLRQLQGVQEGALLKDCLQHCSPYVRDDIARLVPELASAGTAAGASPRQRLFAAVLQCWSVVHQRRPLLIIIEDLHWSDGTTRDFLTYLSAQRSTGSVSLVLTSRPGDTSDKGAAADWSRTPVSAGQWQRIHLTPFTPHEVEAMAASVAPAPLSADQVAVLVRRSDGNPFFVEQLLASGEVTTLPDELAELLRSRAAVTTAAAHDVLRVLAVAGRPLSDDELATVTGHHADQVRGALRELVGAALARPAADGLCTLRHALLGEAIEAGLFAGEQAELHRAVAGLLLDRADPSLAAEAAQHLRRGGRQREELPVRITAAEYCDQVSGYAEASRHWARAVDLAEVLDDGRVAELALRALRSRNVAGTGEPLLEQTERGKCAAVRHGQRQLYALLLLAAATLHSPDMDSSLERGVTELQAAVDAFRGLPPSTDLVSALIGLYWLHCGGGRPAEGMLHLRRAVEVEESLSTSSVMALATLAHAQLVDGDVETGLAALAEARQRMRPDADLETVTRLALAETDCSLQLNRLEEAASEGLAVWNRLRANGWADTYMASSLLGTVGEALRSRGQVDELQRIVEPLTTDQAVGPASWMMHVQRCWADLCGGRLGAASDRLDQIMSRSGQRSFYDKSELAQLGLELALWSNDPRAAVDVALRAIEGMTGVAPEGWAARLLTTAMWASADLVEDARAHRDDTQLRAALQIADQIEAVRTNLLWDPFAEHPYFLTLTVEGREWAAEINRCQGGNQPELWLAIAQEWETLNRPHRAGYAWWRAAGALLNLGQRGPAASALQIANQRSDQHVPLTDAVMQLARLSRVRLEPPSTTPETSNQKSAAPPVLGLTSRELDVLRLLTEGLTNAEIGTRLYMSPKTASVHVTAILRKLQATNRVHAAAIAERLGLTKT